MTNQFTRNFMVGVSLATAIILTYSLANSAARAQFSGVASDPPPLYAGVHAPEFSSTTLAHTLLTSKSLRGHVAVLDFWATWCPTCKSAMPELQTMYEHYRLKGVRFVGMSLDTDQVKQVPATVRKLGVTYTITADPAHNLPTGYMYNAQQLPCVYVIDRRGIVRWSVSGYTKDTEKQLRSHIDQALKEKYRSSGNK